MAQQHRHRRRFQHPFPDWHLVPGGDRAGGLRAVTGVMSLDIPKSALVRFKVTIQPGITLRDLVHAIPYYAIKQGLLTVKEGGKKNIFPAAFWKSSGYQNKRWNRL
ncbi:MAG: hypothetical protein GPOALKHO_001371 [Sodalis sp.]|nr:MAG: hypothetical protein GPOALKHO_001371 [Sodalis sp.]